MHFYSIGWREFHELPIYTFWELSKNIDRIRAEEDKRMLGIICSAFNEPGEFSDMMTERMGDVVITGDEAPNPSAKGVGKLKALMGV